MYLSSPILLAKPWFFVAHGLRLVLALFYVFLAYKSFSGDAKMIADYSRWGYPDWFRLAVAGGQVLGALLLGWPMLSFYGAVLLAGLMVGAVGTHLRHDPPAAAISAVVCLGLCLAFAWLLRPPALRGG